MALIRGPARGHLARVAPEVDARRLVARERA